MKRNGLLIVLLVICLLLYRKCDREMISVLRKPE